MPNQHDLDHLRRLPWLVAARNDIQSLMFRLHQRWRKLDVQKRDFAVGAAFSLWRAAFLLAEKELEKPMKGTDGELITRGRVDESARQFLEQIIRVNAITFGDDMRHAPWTAGYYINNATYRVSEMQGQPRSHLGSSVRSLRTGWNEAFKLLEHFVETGTIPGTGTAPAPEQGAQPQQ